MPLPPTTYSAEGNNVFDATRVLSQKLSRQLHYGHAIVLLVGEELATTQGIKKLLTALSGIVSFVLPLQWLSRGERREKKSLNNERVSIIHLPLKLRKW